MIEADWYQYYPHFTGMPTVPISFPPFPLYISPCLHTFIRVCLGMEWMCLESSSYFTPLVIQVTGISPSWLLECWCPTQQERHYWVHAGRLDWTCDRPSPLTGCPSNVVITRNWFPHYGQQQEPVLNSPTTMKNVCRSVVAWDTFQWAFQNVILWTEREKGMERERENVM